MVMPWVLNLPWSEISRLSKKYEINPKIVGAIVQQESGGESLATRYEENYKWLFTPEVFAASLRISRSTEVIQQKTSWGLMQVMGGLARELGFKGHLVEICRPELGIELGIKQLIRLKARYNENLNDVIASYNAGSPRRAASGEYVNQYYVNSVNKYIQEL